MHSIIKCTLLKNVVHPCKLESFIRMDTSKHCTHLKALIFIDDVLHNNMYRKAITFVSTLLNNCSFLMSMFNTKQEVIIFSQ